MLVVAALRGMLFEALDIEIVLLGGGIWRASRGNGGGVMRSGDSCAGMDNSDVFFKIFYCLFFHLSTCPSFFFVYVFLVLKI